MPTGLLMFMAHASDLIDNRAFVVKISLIGLAALSAVAFHLGRYRDVARWDSAPAAPPATKVHAEASLLIWVGVIACGRPLAYL